MTGITNVGCEKVFAFITVTYPAGSVCTCSCGTKTLRAKGTIGTYVFPVPYAATWTLTCTDGTDTKSKEVAITYYGQSEEISLRYHVLVEKNYSKSAPNKIGATNATVGFDDDGYLRLVCPAASNSYTTMYLNDPIDVTRFSRMEITVQSNGYINNTIFGFADFDSIKAEMSVEEYSAYARDNNSRGSAYSTVKTLEVDLSDLTGEYYLCTNQAGSGSSNYKGNCVIQYAELFVE